MDYYSVLGITPDATEKQIKKAYKTLALKHHPDRGGTEESFIKIHKAYQVLIDPKKRKQYDILGHNNYCEQNTRTQEPYSYPSYKDLIKNLASTRTVVDEFEFTKCYPSTYIGGVFYDPYTDDAYSSASDIKIAKMDRAYQVFDESIQSIQGSQTQIILTIQEMKKLAFVLRQEGMINNAYYQKSLLLIQEYGTQQKIRQEIAEQIEAEEEYANIQEKILLRKIDEIRQWKSDYGEESNHCYNPRQKRHYNPNDGHDQLHDVRKSWRRQSGQLC